ncbi:MAG: AMP-binding protein [Clostridia bacterium]|nr:AMP-binding protein [Clostridia bacterium]
MAKKVKVKIHKKKKTERIFERATCARELCEVAEKHGDRVLFSYFSFDHRLCDITYGEFAEMIKNAAAGLTSLGYAGKKIAVIGESSPQWVCMYLAVLASGGIVIPMDRELAPTEIDGFLKWVDADAIAYAPSLENAMATVRESSDQLSLYIPFKGDERKSGVVSFDQLISIGKPSVEAGYEYPDISDRIEEVAEYLFTSGTTGSSKCVMLSQKNVFAAAMGACETVDFEPDDTIVSVLPMHHTYELMCVLAAMAYGMHICINDSLSHVIKNFKLFKPTGLVLVPLFLYTMHKKIWAEARKGGKENILKMGIIASGTAKAVGIDFRRKVFAQVLDAFGGRLKKIICGGAAIDPLMIEAFENFGISVYEGYGITECSPLAAVTPYYARKYGSVGTAVPCCEVRIDPECEDIGDSGYITGEIQVKGDNVMIGYYDNPAANADVFTPDGWFRTGDVGYMDDDGYFFITGRQKSVIVLENGKNVFPEEIEEYISQIPEIAECVVVGREATENKVDLVAVVYPAYDKFPKDADEAIIRRSLEHSIATMNRKLPTFKRVMKIEVRNVEFEKTSSRKIRRHLVK